MSVQQEFDYIIVGANSAGCVLASRLTQNPNVRVALVEAGGPDNAPEISMPAAFPQLFKTRYDWDYSTEPERGWVSDVSICLVAEHSGAVPP